MKYNPPVGKTGSAAYEDGNRNAGIKGDIPPGAAVEMPQREIVHVIEHVGRTPSSDDNQQLRKSIQDMIDISTGGGETETYVTMALLRSRELHFPEVQTADGRINVSSPGAGLIQIPSGVTILHRGVYPISTSDFIEDDRTFETEANRTYHCYMDLADDGTPYFVDVTDGTYNPELLAESDPAFDSTLDKAMLCRVETSVGNVATITNLANKDRLREQAFASGAGTKEGGSPTGAGAYYRNVFPLNWARSPKVHVTGVPIASGGTFQIEGWTNRIFINEQTRYRVDAHVTNDYFNTLPIGTTIFGELRLLAVD